MKTPIHYTPEIAEEICERLEQGEPLEEICRSEGMPTSRAVNDWENKKVDSVPDSVASDIARARVIGYDAIANRLRHTARGKTEAQGGDSTGDVQRDKLIIETDLKLLSKWSSKYCDKTIHSGDKENPVAITFVDDVKAD